MRGCLALAEKQSRRILTEIGKLQYKYYERIAMGLRGLTNLASLIVGSVTNRVLQTASCPVLVVR